ncbi:unnamed protein product [Acanthoscelides obtectus]|uniref:Uncharacterized protein n=1 Tax=Acanthoscelides obtectus TaxID=200917 RepID=A0A9P0LIU3_ACAOB|nr:unnamed protein product [Acanthoscelides obtectus]CAK1627320.1 hypothetical protein AOBTE_LOCUS4515 [Acanthoscelides obtectus]
MRKGCKISERRVHFEKHCVVDLPVVSYLQKSRLGSARLRKRWRDGNNEIRNTTGKLMNCPVSYVRYILIF